MVCHEYFTILLRNLHLGIGVESSLSGSPHHWVHHLVCFHQLGFYTAVKAGAKCTRSWGNLWLFACNSQGRLSVIKALGF